MPPPITASYAGKTLSIPSRELARWVDDNIPEEWPAEVSQPELDAGHNLAGIATGTPVGRTPCRVGQVYWPCGLARFGVARVVLSSTDALAAWKLSADLRRAGGTQAPPYLQIGPVRLPMHALPPKSLAGRDDKKDLAVMTLVDARYELLSYFNGGQFLPNSYSDWAAAIAALSGIQSVIGIVLDPADPTIPAGYGKPEQDSEFSSQYESLGFLLDAAAWCVGRSAAFRYAQGDKGAIWLKTHARSVTQVAAEMAKPHIMDDRVAGGALLDNLTGATSYQVQLLPAAFRVTFPKYYKNIGYATPADRRWHLRSYADVHSVVIDTRTDLPGFAGARVHRGTKVLRQDGRAQYDQSGAGPMNATQMTALAKLQAADWCWAALAKYDAVLPGIVALEPDGLHDICWTMIDRDPGRGDAEVTTRRTRRPYDYDADQLQNRVGPEGAAGSSTITCDGSKYVCSVACVSNHLIVTYSDGTVASY